MGLDAVLSLVIDAWITLCNLISFRAAALRQVDFPDLYLSEFPISPAQSTFQAAAPV